MKLQQTLEIGKCAVFISCVSPGSCVVVPTALDIN